MLFGKGISLQEDSLWEFTMLCGATESVGKEKNCSVQIQCQAILS